MAALRQFALAALATLWVSVWLVLASGGGAAFAQSDTDTAPVPLSDDAVYTGIIETLERSIEGQADPNPDTVALIQRLRASQNAPVLDVFGTGLGQTDPSLREAITNYDIRFDVDDQGDMVVTETIALTAAGRQIKRGIFRELPRFYKYFGVTQEYDFRLLEVLRNGQPENYATQYNGNAVVWRIGRRDYLLRPGPYTYTIRYSVADAIRRQDEVDELYWNATGTYWQFPIDKARATVTFPDGATVTDVQVYTGGYGGDTGEGVARANGNTAVFETTAPLPERSGMTISASIEKGVIAPLTAEEKATFWWLRWGAAVILGAGSLGLLAFYMGLWGRIGRDPAKRPVFARYAPPEGYGPAAVHYIYNRGHRGMTALSAELLALGGEGAATIHAEKKSTTITELGKSRSEDGQYLLDAIIPYGRRKVTMDGKPDKQLYSGVQQFLAMVANRYGREYYRRNLGWAFLGTIASIMLVVFVLLSDVSTNNVYFFALLAGLIAMNILFYVLLPAPTKKGEEVRSAIEGFKLYLELAEEDRINTGGPLQEQPPMMSVALYERFLPYAVALGVEDNWTRYFRETLPTEAAEYRPRYATGSRLYGRGYDGVGVPIDIGSRVSSALTAGVAKAAPVSQTSGSSSSGGWSSGGGGGGFSGGGGGGGGGGGW